MNRPILRPRLSLLLVLAALLAPLGLAAQDVEITRDVVYGHKDGLAMTFDVLDPRQNANGAGILYMVSGGWYSRYSPPEEAAERFRDLLNRGFTVFVVRHGSSPKYVIPEIVDDVRRATRYIRHHAAEWGVDPNRLGAFGGSAGGHLALMLGTASDNGVAGGEEAFLSEANRIASVVAYYPPVDLRQMARGATNTFDPDQRFPALNFDRDRAAEFSPLLHVSPDDPPTLLIHGTADELVPHSHSERMHEALESAGVTNEMILIEGAPHGFRGEDAERASAALADWFQRTLAPSR